MQYHSQQFTQIAEAAAAHRRPLILQNIHELATDFRAQFPQCEWIDGRSGTIISQWPSKKWCIENDRIVREAWNSQFLYFLRAVMQHTENRPLITLQPEILVDGTPIAEAIQNAQPKTYVVLQTSGEGDDYTRQTVFCGTDYDAAKAIAITTQYIENLQFQSDVRQDLEIWQNGKCIEIEEYSPGLPEIKCNQCDWTGDEDDLIMFQDEDGHSHGCPHCKTDAYLKNLRPH